MHPSALINLPPDHHGGTDHHGGQDHQDHEYAAPVATSAERKWAGLAFVAIAALAMVAAFVG